MQFKMRIGRQISFLFLVLSAGTTAWGQLFPVTANMQLNSPSTTYLTEMTALGSDQLSVDLFFNDFRESFYDVRLRLSIEGNGISLVTSPNFVPPPLRIFPGANGLTGSDLADYLNPNNMLINGMAPATLQAGGSGLPEGIYTFCVQVFDYRRPEVALSINSCAPKLLRKNYPPNLVFPACGSTLTATGQIQDILFQWQSNTDLSIQTIYELSIVEVPPGMNPDDAMNGTGTKILDAEPVLGTSFPYGPDQLPLEVGKRYAYRIRATDAFGATTFENMGLSPTCNFYYGVDANGTVPLVSPVFDELVSVTQQLTFRWDRPANAPTDQQVYYKLKAVRLLDGQDPEIALQYNPIWYEVTTPVLPGGSAEVLPLTMYPLPAEEQYAWEVKAYSENNGVEQEVAISERRPFQSAPAVERFKAGNPDANLITVLSLSKNEDLATGQKRISGVGRMQIRENGEEVELHFTDVVVGPYQDFWQLEQGVITEPLNNFLVRLDNSGNPAGDPENLDNYGRADFAATHVVVEKDDLKLRGRVKWRLPHAVAGGMPVLQSVDTALLYNRYQLINSQIAVEGKSFDLLDPYGFQLTYEASAAGSGTQFAVYQNILTLTLDGGMTTPAKVKNTGGERIAYHFQAVDNPYYFTASNVESDDDIKIGNGVAIQVNPRVMTFDLSEEQSPGWMTEVAWKGLYCDDFVLRVPSNFDESGQIVTSGEIQLAYLQTEELESICTIDPTGLALNVFHDWEGAGPEVIANTFKSNINSFLLEIEKNQFVDSTSYLAGFLGLPFFSPYDYFEWRADISGTGFQPMYLEEGLAGANYTMNEDDYLRSVNVTINQAAFVNGNHIRMAIDFEYPAIAVALADIPDFCMWGDGRVGFNTPGSPHFLANQVNGYMPGNETFEYTVDKIWAISDSYTGLYGFVVGGATYMGETLAGPSKETRMNIGSTRMVGEANTGTETGGNAVEDPINFLGADLPLGASFVNNDVMGFQAKLQAGPTISFNATLFYQPDDPTWGDVNYSLLKAQFGIPVLMPTTYEFLLQFISGRQKPEVGAAFSYWFLEFGLGSIEQTDQDAVLRLRQDVLGDLRNYKNNLDHTRTSISDAVDYASLKMTSLSNSLQSTLEALTATDPDAEPKRFLYLRNKAQQLNSRIKLQYDVMVYRANDMYYGVADSRNRSNAIDNGTRDRSNAIDRSGEYSVRLKIEVEKAKLKAREYSAALKQKTTAVKSSIYDGASAFTLKVNSACNLLAAHGRSASSWAGAKVKVGAEYAKTKFKASGGDDVDSPFKIKVKANLNAGKAAAARLAKALSDLPTGIPMGSLLLVGVQGRLYHHMSHDVTAGVIKGVEAGATTASEGTSDPSAYERMTVAEYPETTAFSYRPDANTAFGVMLMGNIETLELPDPGRTFRGYGAFEMAFTNGGDFQSLGLEVEGGFMNLEVPVIINRAMARGYLNIGWHRPERKFRAQGYFKTETNALCGVGNFDFTLTNTSTLFRLASPQRKTFLLPGCLGFYGPGYVDFNAIKGGSATLELGVGLGFQATYRQKIELVVATVTAYASLGLELGLSGKVQIRPEVEVERFGAWMDAWAMVGVYVDWPWPVPNQDIGIGATLSGNVDIYPGSPWRAAGTLKGKIIVVGLDFNFSLKFDENI